MAVAPPKDLLKSTVIPSLVEPLKPFKVKFGEKDIEWKLPAVVKAENFDGSYDSVTITKVRLGESK